MSDSYFKPPALLEVFDLFNNEISQLSLQYYRKRFSCWVVIGTALISFFSPSSIGGVIYARSTIWVCAVVILLLATTVRLQRVQFINALVIIILFLTFTVLSPFSYIAWGGLTPYLLLLIVLMTDLSKIYAKDIKYKSIAVLFFINIALLIFGFATVFKNEFAFNISEIYYQAYDENLFESMLIWESKPVTVFASHSIAAFAYFALFCLNLRVANSKDLMWIVKKIFLTQGICYMCLIPFLKSNTALFLFLLTIPIFLSFLFNDWSSYIKQAVNLINLLFIFVFGFFLVNWINIDLLGMIVDITSGKGNGVLGRYASGGRLQGSYDFLFDNYFQPIGLTSSSIISIGDNFIAEYILKISIFGYLVILFMFFVWLRQNVFDKHGRIGIFLFFIFADLGYPLLPYYRAIGFLPLFVIIWNNSQPEEIS